MDIKEYTKGLVEYEVIVVTSCGRHYTFTEYHYGSDVDRITESVFEDIPRAQFVSVFRLN